MNIYDFHKEPHILKGHHERNDIVPFDVLAIARTGKRLNQRQIKAIASTASTAWQYSEFVLHDKFPEGEDAISKDPTSSWNYAYAFFRNKNGWPKGEDAIAKNAQTAFYYAQYIKEGRWPKGEDAIATSSIYSKWYAETVLNARFLKGEKTIAKYPDDKQEYEECFGIKLT